MVPHVSPNLSPSLPPSIFPLPSHPLTGKGGYPCFAIEGVLWAI